MLANVFANIEIVTKNMPDSFNHLGLLIRLAKIIIHNNHFPDAEEHTAQANQLRSQLA